MELIQHEDMAMQRMMELRYLTLPCAFLSMGLFKLYYHSIRASTTTCFTTVHLSLVQGVAGRQVQSSQNIDIATTV